MGVLEPVADVLERKGEGVAELLQLVRRPPGGVHDRQDRKHLAEHSSTVDDIFERIARFVEGFTDTPMTELNSAFQRLARVTYKTATSHIKDRETVEKLRDIIRRAAEEIEGVAK